MSLPNYLANIKSSGVYRFTFDKSQIPDTYSTTLRLVVGYSDKGPFNVPVYVDSTTKFKQLFGDISRTQEKKGIFFHRLAQQALSGGPIVCLNIKPFNEGEEKEVVGMLGFNSTSQETEVMNVPVAPYEGYSGGALYDVNRFWTLDSKRIHKLGIGESEKYIRFVHTDDIKNSVSLIVEPTVPKGYDISIDEWYKNLGEELPEFLEPIKDELVENYFMKVHLFRGDIFNKELFEVGGIGKSLYITLNKVEDQYWDPEENYPIYDSIQVGEKTYKIFENLNVDQPDLDPDWHLYEEEDSYFKTFKKDTNLLSQYDNKRIVTEDDKTYLAWIPMVDFDDDDKPYVRGSISDLVEALYYKYESSYINYYIGSTIPGLKNEYGKYITISEAINSDFNSHKILMDLNEDLIEDCTKEELNEYIKPEVSIIHYLKGFEYKSISKKEKGLPLVDKILDFIKDGLLDALTNNVDIEYHYLVDTFDTYPGQEMKKQLGQIARMKDNAIALLNAPSIKNCIEFTNSKNNSGFNMSNVTKRGSGITLVSEANGASWSAYYSQLMCGDGTTKFNIPSAALVSNLFMNKQNTRQAFGIVAGTKYGVISTSGTPVISPDYNFSRQDLDDLEVFGINAIIYTPRYGIYINSNQTAKQSPKSALSKVNIRELVILIQNEIEYILRSYDWDTNVATTRDSVKKRVDSLLENIMNNGGLLNYVTTCDRTNNTDEVIENEMLVVDVDIEPAFGCGKLVQTITIHRTGKLESK